MNEQEVLEWLESQQERTVACGWTAVAGWFDEAIAKFPSKQAAEIARLRRAIETHRDQKGDDRCWLDDLVLYAAIGEPNAVQQLPPKCEFLKSCERYWEQRQSPLDKETVAGDMTIGQLERENARLRAALEGK